MKTGVHFSSATDDWSTPQDLFDNLNSEFGFTLDVCASEENKKVKNFYSKADDGLTQDWSKYRCWMNPPYGREIGKWVEKAATSGAKVVALLPARTDTRWWWDWIQENPKAEVRFIKGRLKFGGQKNSAPFPSVIVIFRP